MKVFFPEEVITTLLAGDLGSIRYSHFLFPYKPKPETYFRESQRPLSQSFTEAVIYRLKTKKIVVMNMEKREAPEKKEEKEKSETNNKPFQLSNSAKITLSVGVVLSLTLVSLALVVHSLGNVDLKLRLNRRK